MYEDLDDPKYDGDPAETLERVAKMMDDHYFIDKDAPYYQNLNPPGASDFETTIIPDSDTTRQHMLVGEFNRLVSPVFPDSMYSTGAPHLASWSMTRVSLGF